MSVMPCKTVECHLEAVKTKYKVDGVWFLLPDGSKVWKGAGLLAKEKEKAH